MQERFGLLLPVQPEHQLRSVTLAAMLPDQVLDVFRQAYLVVVGKASQSVCPGAGWHDRKWRHVVHDGGLAPSVAADDRDQLSVAGEPLEIELDHFATQPIANATKTFERQRDWSHGDSRLERRRLECPT